MAVELVPASRGWAPAAGACLAFLVAGARIGDARVPALHGAVAATLPHLLFLPLSLTVSRPSTPIYVLLTAGLAVVVGAAGGALAGTLQRRTQARTSTRVSRR